MRSQTLNYSEYYEFIVALVTYLAVCNIKTSKKTIDNADAGRLAKHLGLEANEVRTVLAGYKGLFRESEKKYGGQHRYSLLLRYAHRPYTDPKAPDVSEPLSNEELFSLLNFISNRVREEQEEKRHADNSRSQRLAMFIAAFSALIAAGVSLFTVLAT